MYLVLHSIYPAYSNRAYKIKETMMLCPYDFKGLPENLDPDIDSWKRCCGVPMPPPGAIIRITRVPRQYAYTPEPGTELIIVGTSQEDNINSHTIQVSYRPDVFDIFERRELAEIRTKMEILGANLVLNLLHKKMRELGLTYKDMGMNILFIGYGVLGQVANAYNPDDICFKIIGANLALWGK